MKIKQKELKSNGYFSILEDVFPKNQHTNQQNGLDLYIKILDHNTGYINCVKLYENTKGLFFKKNGNQYLDQFTQKVLYIPQQIINIK